MKNEATTPVRNAGLRAPLETTHGPDTTGRARSAAHAHAGDARTRSGTSGSAARPFEESMTQAMRRTQSKPTNEARKTDEGRARDDESVSTHETKTGCGEAAASERAASTQDAQPSSTQGAQPSQAAPSAPEASGAAETPNETAASIADSSGAAAGAAAIAKETLPADATSASGAAQGSVGTPSSDTGRAAAGMKAGATSATSASADLETASAAPLATETPLEATDASKLASGDSPSRSGADTLLARSTADFAAQLAQARGATAAHSSPPTDAASPSTPTAHSAALHRSDMSTSIGDALFPGRFAAEVALLGSAGIERAEIRLQPRELGPVRVELSMSGESTRIAFSAVQPETRQAIEQSLPILKDLLAERGLTLGEASVSDGHAGRGSADPEATPSHAATRDGRPTGGADRPFSADARHTPIRRTLLDVYV